MVSETWNSAGTNLSSKLLEIGRALGSWGRIKFGEIPKKVDDTKVCLERLQGSFQSYEVLAETHEVEHQLNSLLEQEEIVWCQRSRAS